MKKKWFSVSNITTAVMVVFLAAMVISPEVKAWTIQTLMKVGLFQPKIDKQPDAASAEALPNVFFRKGDGKTVDLASLKGKVIFINFWATWCPPCIAEMPSINALYGKFKDNENVVFLMVDVDGNYQKSDSFMKKHHYGLEVVSPAVEIPPVFMQGAVPTTVILDKEGKMVYRQEGAADYNSPKLVDMISKLAN
ncbi:TlpA family protein disulfide reductase [Dyadobacter frigoris]|uniref:TlpA family protein disulfide reductase n=1 Tax=Dyadobacter frigoris TaxID=2576211 RepID=A0A4U6D6W1_9BACT|nr:TlpA disulfide reductase family protein [Dyadobacter frigoris]TKT92195.1 TlpA family protein disulfide reductase [Dyadobacter frigoris]GLU53360.1 alkyl hydroperoxide reductase [Dyadobacter frigoris]